jgi:hypothetical protein
VKALRNDDFVAHLATACQGHPEIIAEEIGWPIFREVEYASAAINMTSNTNDAETIRRETARIRHKHHDDIAKVLAGAETIAGWGRHIRLCC